MVDFGIHFVDFQQSLSKLVGIGGRQKIIWGLKHVLFDGFKECKCKVVNYDFAFGKFVRCLNIFEADIAVEEEECNFIT